MARITSDVLNRNKDNPNFELTLLTCSITYLHRDNFRSDVLVSFNPPIKINLREHRELFGIPPSPGKSGPNQLDGIKQLTSLMQEQIRQGTIDAPNFGIVRVANTARRIYAPLGTRMTLGDTVHITQRFVDIFARQMVSKPRTPAEALFTPLPPESSSFDSIAPKSPTTRQTKQETPAGLGLDQASTSALDQGYFDIKPVSETPVTDDDIRKLEADLHVGVTASPLRACTNPAR